MSFLQETAYIWPTQAERIYWTLHTLLHYNAHTAVFTGSFVERTLTVDDKMAAKRISRQYYTCRRPTGHKYKWVGQVTGIINPKLKLTSPEKWIKKQHLEEVTSTDSTSSIISWIVVLIWVYISPNQQRRRTDWSFWPQGQWWQHHRVQKYHRQEALRLSTHVVTTDMPAHATAV
jgi:hypothetical protein